MKFPHPGTPPPVKSRLSSRTIILLSCLVVGLIIASLVGVRLIGQQVATLSHPKPTKPVARFTVDIGEAGFSNFIYLDSSRSSVGKGTSLSEYDWDFGDGATFRSDAQFYGAEKTEHKYGQAGTYTVTLVVKDGSGQTSDPSTTQVHVTMPTT